MTEHKNQNYEEWKIHGLTKVVPGFVEGHAELLVEVLEGEWRHAREDEGLGGRAQTQQHVHGVQELVGGLKGHFVNHHGNKVYIIKVGTFDWFTKTFDLLQ